MGTVEDYLLDSKGHSGFAPGVPESLGSRMPLPRPDLKMPRLNSENAVLRLFASANVEYKKLTSDAA